MTAEDLVVLAHLTPGIGNTALSAILNGLAVSGLIPADLQHLTETELRRSFNLNQEQSTALRKALQAPSREFTEVRHRLRAARVEILTVLDAAYPTQLVRAMAHPPAALYLHGNVANVQAPLVAVCNSNRPSAEVALASRMAIESAVAEGYIPVTGHNRPEYQSVALAALRHGYPSCYVLDRGILGYVQGRNDAPPFKAARIWPPPIHGADVIISPFSPVATGSPGWNLQRDSLIAGLARIILVGHLRAGGHMQRVLEDAVSSRKPVRWIGPGDRTPDWLPTSNHEETLTEALRNNRSAP